MSKYRCAKCKKILERSSTKVWIKSYCTTAGVTTRIYRVADA